MPIRDYNDAVEVERAAGRIFDASPDGRAAEIRGLFVEVLDFAPASGQVALPGVSTDPVLPGAAERIAELDGFHVIYVPLKPSNTDRVRKGDVDKAARLIADQIGEDVLLVFTNPSASQVHVVLPDFTKSRISLRRMVVERDLPRRTAVQQVSNIYWRYQASGSIRTALDEAFDVGPVTKEFFEEYKRLHKMAIERVQGFGTEGDEEEQKKLFVQTLYNRLMFIYFLSRKGWLSFPGPDGEADFDYLNALWRDYSTKDEQNKNFHMQRLSLLFFAGLNNPQCRDLSVNNPVVYSLIGNVPFLNGGLFEESDLDKRQGILVPDDVIERVLSQLFDRFNFTIMESTPFDIEVAVDPEMLGKAFEELVTGRHDTGSYYTPRNVVSFMCREVLKGYLEGQDTGVDAEAIGRFVEGQNTSGITVVAARRISEALADVKVLDPACGSGAYLLGMMQELIELQTALFNVGVDSKALYDLKLEIIQRNLYGVDIDEFAANIAMLRLWLSLAIDYEEAKPEPLPNLDFKIVVGDSLLGPDPGLLDQSRYMIDVSQVPDLKARYMRATADKSRLKQEILAAEEQLRQDMGVTAMPEGVVDWRIEFADVFSQHGGFDVVIANPPYVEARSDAIPTERKEAYRSRLQSDWGDTLPRGSDLLIYFFPRAAKLLAQNGKACFITQNAWLSTDYGYKFQQFSLGRFSFQAIIDTDSKFFASVGGPSINAVIAFFTTEISPEIEYATANSAMEITMVKKVRADSQMKWGHLFAMNPTFSGIISTLHSRSGTSTHVTFGQGLNFPKSALNHRAATIDVITKSVGFSALSADAKIADIPSSRVGRAPALIMPRGIGNRHYCTFNNCKAYSWSAVELYLPDELWYSNTHYCLWAYLNSSFVWLFREVTGRTNLGGGMLKAEASDMKLLPVGFDFDFVDSAKEVLSMLQEREPLPVEHEVYSREHLLIDDMVAEFLGFADQQDDIRRELIHKVAFRANRGRT